MVPIVHDDAHVGAVTDGVLQLRVAAHDVLENHRDVVLVGTSAALHHHGRTDGDGRNHDVGENQILRTTGGFVQPNQRQVLGGNPLEEVENHLGREIFLRVTRRIRSNRRFVHVGADLAVVFAGGLEGVLDGRLFFLREFMRVDDVFLEMKLFA